MKWLLKAPEFGDMIRVKLGELYHYGIFSSDDEVIQFGLAPNLRFNIPESEVFVTSTDIDKFLAGGFLEVAELDKKEKKKRYPPEKTVELAKSKIGDGGYSMLLNNCEHFAYFCTFGIRYSSQSEALRERFLNIPTLDVYIASIPEDIKIKSVFPKSKDKEISSVRNESLRKQKYYAWKLLEIAISRSFGYKIKNITFDKLPNGKPTASSFEFSISHSDSVVAVAVSRTPVGVDIQKFKQLASEGFAEKVLAENEKSKYYALDEDSKPKYLISAWTKKESIYKYLNLPCYIPAEIDSEAHKVYFDTLEFCGETYYLSVANQHIDKIRIFHGIDLGE